MKKQFLILFLLVLSADSLKAQSIEDGLVYFKWNFSEDVCNIKVGDSLLLLSNQTTGIQFKKIFAGAVKLKKLNGIQPCINSPQAFNVTIKVLNTHAVADKLVVTFEMLLRIDKKKYYYLGQGYNTSGDISFVRIK